MKRKIGRFATLGLTAILAASGCSARSMYSSAQWNSMTSEQQRQAEVEHKRKVEGVLVNVALGGLGAALNLRGMQPGGSPYKVGGAVVGLARKGLSYDNSRHQIGEQPRINYSTSGARRTEDFGPAVEGANSGLEEFGSGLSNYYERNKSVRGPGVDNFYLEGCDGEDGQKGLKIKAELDIPSDGKFRLAAYFERDNGKKLMDKDGLCRADDGQVAIFSDLENTKNIEIFFPVSQLDISNPGVHDLGVYLTLWDVTSETPSIVSSTNSLPFRVVNDF